MNHMLIFSPSEYVTCVYNSFWWVDMVSLADIAAGAVINQLLLYLPGDPVFAKLLYIVMILLLMENILFK